MGIETADNDRVDLGLVFAMNGCRTPSFFEVDGRHLVLLTQEEYSELVAARSKLLLGVGLSPQKPQARGSAKPHLGLSTIERDPEVAEYLRGQFRGGVTLDQLRAACRERFGEARTPSVNRIGRFRAKII